MQSPTVSSTVPGDRRAPLIWSNADRVVACDGNGSVIGTFETVAQAERALVRGVTRRLSLFSRRPRYARAAA